MTWPWQRHRRDPLIDGLIREKGAKVKFSRADDALRQRTVDRRRYAESLRGEASRIDTGSESDARRKLHLA